jgi:hypothetical protein
MESSAVFNAPAVLDANESRSEAVRATPGGGSPAAGWQRGKSITLGEPEPPEQVAERARSGVAEQSRQMFATHCAVEFPPVPARSLARVEACPGLFMRLAHVSGFASSDGARKVYLPSERLS